MHEWLVLADFGADLGALAPGLMFAAGALAVTLVQCAIVAGAGWLRWRRGRARVFPPDDPRRVWAELKELRAECAASTGDLETAVAQLKDRTAAHLVERSSSAQQLRDALDQKAPRIDALERQVAALELAQARDVLELQRKDEELGSRSEALASAQQTIALLHGMLDVSGRAREHVSDRAAG